MTELNHFDENGASRMVDVSEKAATTRVAVASARVTMRPETAKLIRDRSVSKGNVLEVARLAGIMASKQTSQLIPLCHPISISNVEINFDFVGSNQIKIISQVKTTGQTGVEMEALTAAATTALTIYDMCKSVDRAMTIEQIRLEEKSGGKSGHFVRSSD